ncbi:DMT family transporter [Peribacillus muralis]|uniref:DMT family transporter n=1 Tax=Peribacillus muralis TaxID=264697 RepID=UPI00366E305E
MQRWTYLFIITGAVLWGTIGLFVHKLYDYGFSPLQVVAIRVIFASLFLLVYITLKKPALLKIKVQDCKYFIGTGIMSIVFFNWCYFTAIKETSLSIAAILLYTGPIFVTLLSRIFFQEYLTKNKIAALVITFLGCALVIEIFPNSSEAVSFYSFIVGLGAGFGYALYSIFGKYALIKYNALTVTTYTFIFASLVMIPTTGLWNSWELFLDEEVLSYSIGLGFIPTVLAFFLYTTGLTYVESSTGSIMTTIEPVVATLMGVILFGEALSPWQVMGVLLVITAVILVQPKEKKINGSIEDSSFLD